MLIALGIPCFVLGQELYNNDVDSAEYHYAIATELLEADLLDSATYHLTKSLAYGKENSDWDIINLALSDLGYLSFLTEEYEKSLQCFDAAINNALAHTPQDTLFIEDNYYYAGAVANDIQDYDQALHYLNNSLNISIKKNKITSIKH